MVLKKGSRGTDVKELQAALKELGYNVGIVDGDFGSATKRQVELFQEANDLYQDGIVGKGTLTIMNEKLPEELKFKIDGEPDPDETFIKLPWTMVDADQIKGANGYSRFYLREDAAEAYNALRSDVLALGGVITSAGAKRPITDSKRMASRSIKSLHYTGLAFDLALDSGMNNPRKERFVIEELDNREWNVWCRTEDESVPVRRLEGYTYSNTKVVVEDRFFSFTELARKHGFESIKSRRYFKTGGSYLGAEWWHFQFEEALEPGVSTFGGELLKIYSLSELKSKFEPWEITKNAVWQKSWF